MACVHVEDIIMTAAARRLEGERAPLRRGKLVWLKAFSACCAMNTVCACNVKDGMQK